MGVKSRRRACKVLVVKPEGKRPCGRERLWWEDEIKIDQEMELGRGLYVTRDRDR